MTPGTLLVALAFVAALGATVALFRDYAADADTYATVANRAILAAAAFFLSALVVLTYQFVTTDYANAYVWQNTASYLSVLYRITGVYAGNAGSVLLWATLVAVVAAWATLARGLDGRTTKLVQATTMAVVAYFAGMLVLQNPFASTVAKFPEQTGGVVPMSGQGLNPLLVDPYMAIHPPVMFSGYALLTMPFAIGVAHFVSLLRGEGGLYADWIGSVTRWLRVAWLALTAAVALGALWSYTVLGWGGIWAWDPVETAILVPWLFLTATLHAVTNYDPDGDYTVLAPAMTATVFALAVYTTTVVRSGVFRSVHSFANDGIGISMLVLMGVTLLFGVVVPFGYWFMQDGDPRSGSREWLTRSNLLHLAVLVLGLLTFVSMWGLTFPLLRDLTTGIEVSVDAQYYNLWSYPLVLAALLLLGFYMDLDVEGKRRSLVGVGVFAGMTIAAATIHPSSTWQLASVSPDDALIYRLVGNASALSVLPPVAYVGIALGKRGLQRLPAAADRNAKLRETGVLLVHVGVATLVLSLTFTYLFTGQASVVATGVGQGGVDASTMDVPDTDYSIRVLDYTETTKPNDPDPESYALSTTSLVERGPQLNGSVQRLHGRVTNVREGPRATVVQLDDSGVWLGLPNATAQQAGVAVGDRVVARGLVMWNYVPQADAVLLTSPRGVGAASNPPKAVVPTRVTAEHVDLAVYENGERVVRGRPGQRTYPQQGGLQVRDVVVDRGLLADTYVIAGVGDDGVSITVKRVPLMTPIRLSVFLLLLGMSLIALFDPEHGIWHLRTAANRPADRPTTSD
jgi:cytochrome c-type biogenesis protein CcmF